jgi:hypothetical protein
LPRQDLPTDVADALADATRIRAQAEREAAEILAEARRRADAFAEARIARLRELSDRLITAAAGLDRRLSDAADVSRQLDELVAALGAAAERAARDEAPEPRPERRFEPPPAAPEPVRVRSPRSGAVVEVVPDTRGPRPGSAVA